MSVLGSVSKEVGPSQGSLDGAWEEELRRSEHAPEPRPWGTGLRQLRKQRKSKDVWEKGGRARVDPRKGEGP